MNRSVLLCCSLALGVALTVAAGCGSKTGAAASKHDPSMGSVQESAWVESIDEGMALAQSSGKMMLVDFGAEW